MNVRKQFVLNKILYIYDRLEADVLNEKITISEMDKSWNEILSAYNMSMKDWESEIDRRWDYISNIDSFLKNEDISKPD